MTISSLSSSAINTNLPVAPQPQGVRSGAGQQSPAVTLPQSNGVNITIIDPVTTVGSATGNEKLTANPADSFTPSATATPPTAPTAVAPPAAGGLGYQQPSYY
jgi:hypothetical protein